MIKPQKRKSLYPLENHSLYCFEPELCHIPFTTITAHIGTAWSFREGVSEGRRGAQSVWIQFQDTDSNPMVNKHSEHE